MVTHLYTNFLENKEVYQKNMDFWERIVHTIMSAENMIVESYLTTTKPDGSLYLDGNPIYHFKVENRGVRIIQEEIEKDSIVFSAWIDSTQLSDETVIDELVISMELSQESCLLAVEFINSWIINRLPITKIEKQIDTVFVLKDTIVQVKNDTTEQIEYA